MINCYNYNGQSTRESSKVSSQLLDIFLAPAVFLLENYSPLSTQLYRLIHYSRESFLSDDLLFLIMIL